MALLMQHGLIGLRIIPETSNSRLFTLQNSDTIDKNKWQIFKSLLKVIGLGIMHKLIILLMLPLIISALVGLGAAWIVEKTFDGSLGFLNHNLDVIKTQHNYK